MSWFVKCLKNYANFKGRARRKEYWFFFLFVWIMAIVAMLLDNLLSTTYSMGLVTLPYGVIYSIVMVALIIPNLAVLVRRLHDTGRSGVWFFIIFVPVVGLIMMLVFLLTEGTPEANAYGPNPKEEEMM